VGVVLGVPGVAVGITFTQLGWGTAIEMAAGTGLALAALFVAVLHVRLALDGGEPPEQGTGDRDPVRESVFQPVPGPAKVLLGIAGVSLFFGMAFAATYALRFSALPLPRFDLATMRLLHGTVNAIGFSLCGVVGWRMVLRSTAN
jgi:hypothetical protein